MIDIIYKCNSKILYYMFFLTNGENEINITNHGRLLCTKIKLCA